MAVFLLVCHVLGLLKPVLASSASADFISEELAAASGNISALRHDIAPAWVSSPQVRGTSDILSSCLVTLTACVYTAIHLNVPPLHETKLHFLWRKVKWVALALFAPEIVLYTAFKQFAEARVLVKELNQLRFGNGNGDSTRDPAKDMHDTNATNSSIHVPSASSEVSDSIPRYDLRFGFFIVMGGCITKDVAQISDKYTYCSITPEAAIVFARQGLYFDLSPGKIADKSKANLFGKGLVCAQVIWFVTQCIARAIASYPLVLIEVHTMVHVVCALAIYVLWWNVSDLDSTSLPSSIRLTRYHQKPQDVSDPEIIDLSGHMSTLALDLIRLDALDSRHFGYESPHDSPDQNLYLATRVPEETQYMTAEEKANIKSWIGDGDPSLELKIVDAKEKNRSFGGEESFALVWFCATLYGVEKIRSGTNQSCSEALVQRPSKMAIYRPSFP